MVRPHFPRTPNAVTNAAKSIRGTHSNLRGLPCIPSHKVLEQNAARRPVEDWLGLFVRFPSQEFLEQGITLGATERRCLIRALNVRSDRRLSI